MDCRPPALAEEGSAKQEGGHPPVAMARVFHPVRRQGGYFYTKKQKGIIVWNTGYPELKR